MYIFKEKLEITSAVIVVRGLEVNIFPFITYEPEILVLIALASYKGSDKPA